MFEPEFFDSQMVDLQADTYFYGTFAFVDIYSNHYLIIFFINDLNLV